MSVARLVSATIAKQSRFMGPFLEDRTRDPLYTTVGCSKGDVTLGNGSCNLSRNGVSPFSREVAEMVLHCAMILATRFAAATAEDSPE